MGACTHTGSLQFFYTAKGCRAVCGKRKKEKKKEKKKRKDCPASNTGWLEILNTSKEF